MRYLLPSIDTTCTSITTRSIGKTVLYCASGALISLDGHLACLDAHTSQLLHQFFISLWTFTQHNFSLIRPIVLATHIWHNVGRLCSKWSIDGLGTTSCLVILIVTFSERHTTIELQTVPLGPICFSSLTLGSPACPSDTLLPPNDYRMYVLILLLCLSQICCSPSDDIWVMIGYCWLAWHIFSSSVLLLPMQVISQFKSLSRWLQGWCRHGHLERASPLLWLTPDQCCMSKSYCWIHRSICPEAALKFRMLFSFW